MKLKLKFPYCFIVAFFLFMNFGHAQIGMGTNNPDSSAQLDVFSNKKGFLPPRLALTATNIAAPVNNPAVGLLIFNTATSGNFPNSVNPGYYYWNGTAWYQIINKGNAPGDMQYWNGKNWIIIPIGANGSVLTVCAGIPTWGLCSPITIQPGNNQNEVHVDSYNLAGGSGDTELEIGTWTINGISTNWRSFVKFDQSQLPINAKITNATLYLYSMPVPHAGNGVNAQFGSANSFYIERITGDWNPLSFNWNTQPATTVTNRVTVPQSTSGVENIAVDVTGLLKDMQANGNYGFAFRLQSEIYYNMRQYASSFYSDSSLHPKLIISFQ